MNPIVDNLQFYSGYPIDKVFAQGSLTLAVPAATGPLNPGVATTTVPNPYGHAGFTTLSFSIDNVNFYNQNSSIEYWDTVDLLTVPQMTVTSACRADLIYFKAISFYVPGPQTVFINYAVDAV